MIFPEKTPKNACAFSCGTPVFVQYFFVFAEAVMLLSSTSVFPRSFALFPKQPKRASSKDARCPFHPRNTTNATKEVAMSRKFLWLTLFVLFSGCAQEPGVENHENPGVFAAAKQGDSPAAASRLDAFRNTNRPAASCFLNVGETGIHYQHTNVAEIQGWGPAAFTVAPDGSFWVADTAGYRVVEVRPDCSMGRIISMPDRVVGIVDLEIADRGVWVLDAAAQKPAVYLFSFDGRELSRLPLDETAESATGLTIVNGMPAVEYEFGAYLEELSQWDGEKTGRIHVYHQAGDHLVSAVPADMSRPDASRGYIEFDGRILPVEVENALGGLRFVGAAQNGSFFVMAEEVSYTDAVDVDRTVWRFDAKGNFTGIARVPLDESAVHVEHNVAVAPDGSVYALIAGEKRVEIRRLEFADKLESILPPAWDTAAEDAVPPPPGTCVSRTTIMNTAWAIRNNSKYLSSTNTDGSCSGRGKPRYIGGAGTYRSVAYDWGGFDSLSDYNAAMSPGTGKAGDINTAGVESCSRGLDCSGFVSRAWQRTTKYGTSTLSQISYQLSSTSSLLQGDVMNKSGSHVVLFESYASGGIWTLESTTTNSYDRAVYITRSWSALSGYVPRRLSSVCP